MPVLVHLADGSQVPLVDWTLSYEYLTWAIGQSQFAAHPLRRESRELWVGKRRLPTAGMGLELVYADEKPSFQGEAKRAAPGLRALRLSAAEGTKDELKPEAPTRDLLLPPDQKKMVLLVRSLDLVGQSLTGTRRQFCLVSYSSLVECGEPRVVKLEFPR